MRQASKGREWYKLISPGSGPDGRVFVEIELHHRNDHTEDQSERELSIAGVEGPKRNGDARGGCGQIVDSLADIYELSEGWTPEMVAKLADVWNRWHLNDMKAGCEHQRAAGWGTTPIDPDKPTNSYGRHFPDQKHDTWNLAGWVKRSEWEGGLMCEPCWVCGYRYGTAWLYEAIPDDVLDWLRALPDNTYVYAWENL